MKGGILWDAKKVEKRNKLNKPCESGAFLLWGKRCQIN